MYLCTHTNWHLNFNSTYCAGVWLAFGDPIPKKSNMITQDCKLKTISSVLKSTSMLLCFLAASIVLMLVVVSLILTWTKLSSFSPSSKEAEEGHIDGGGVTGRVDPWGASFLAIEFNFCGRESLFPTAEPPRPPIAVKSLSAQVNNFLKVFFRLPFWM